MIHIRRLCAIRAHRNWCIAMIACDAWDLASLKATNPHSIFPFHPNTIRPTITRHSGIQRQQATSRPQLQVTVSSLNFQVSRGGTRPTRTNLLLSVMMLSDKL